jgi:hypothetical protein
VGAADLLMREARARRMQGWVDFAAVKQAVSLEAVLAH